MRPAPCPAVQVARQIAERRMDHPDAFHPRIQCCRDDAQRTALTIATDPEVHAIESRQTEDEIHRSHTAGIHTFVVKTIPMIVVEKEISFQCPVLQIPVDRWIQIYRDAMNADRQYNDVSIHQFRVRLIRSNPGPRHL